MTDTKYMGFDALTPFFDLITQALTGMVDGKHFFDIFNGTIVFEYPYASSISSSGYTPVFAATPIVRRFDLSSPDGFQPETDSWRYRNSRRQFPSRPYFCTRKQQGRKRPCPLLASRRR
jgi:hypothetical protein